MVTGKRRVDKNRSKWEMEYERAREQARQEKMSFIDAIHLDAIRPDHTAYHSSQQWERRGHLLIGRERKKKKQQIRWNNKYWMPEHQINCINKSFKE